MFASSRDETPGMRVTPMDPRPTRTALSIADRSSRAQRQNIVTFVRVGRHHVTVRSHVAYENPYAVVESSPYFEQETQSRNERCGGIAKRLKNACSYLTDAEFVVLVDKIANVQLVAERALAAKACLA